MPACCVSLIFLLALPAEYHFRFCHEPPFRYGSAAGFTEAEQTTVYANDGFLNVLNYLSFMAPDGQFNSPVRLNRCVIHYIRQISMIIFHPGYHNLRQHQTEDHFFTAPLTFLTMKIDRKSLIFACRSSLSNS